MITWHFHCCFHAISNRVIVWRHAPWESLRAGKASHARTVTTAARHAMAHLRATASPAPQESTWHQRVPAGMSALMEHMQVRNQQSWHGLTRLWRGLVREKFDIVRYVPLFEQNTDREMASAAVNCLFYEKQTAQPVISTAFRPTRKTLYPQFPLNMQR